MKIEYSSRWFKTNVDKFDSWFNSDTFDWGNSSELARYCSDHFDKWYDISKYNLDDWDSLVMGCSDHFDKWWNADTCHNYGEFWRSETNMTHLVMHCPEHFKKWWNADKFSWINRFALIENCGKYIDIWYDADRFVGSYDECLMGFSHQELRKVTYTQEWFKENIDTFDEWFAESKLDKFQFCGHGSQLLAMCCSKYFDTWFDPSTFDWEYGKRLAEYCIDYIDIWYDSSKFTESYEELLLQSIK